jgi:hypothetical protein
MKYKLANGQLVGEFQAFTFNEIQYPENWISLSSQQERQALGLQEYQEQQRPDDRFYFVTDNGDGTYSTVAKELEDGAEYVDLRGVTRRVQGLKSQMIAQVKATAGSMLAVTDWKVVRASEGVKAVDADTLAERAAIRTASDANEAAITACTSVTQLAALKLTWPV